MHLNLRVFFIVLILIASLPFDTQAADQIKDLGVFSELPDLSTNDLNVMSVSERLSIILKAMIPGCRIFIDGTLPMSPDYSLPLSFNVYLVRRETVQMFRIQGFFDSNRQLQITGVQSVDSISNCGIRPFPGNI
ncbi:hypothetical protein ACOME3_003250 [Neoechinorhynchus agilis]